VNDTCILLVEDEPNDVLLLKIAFEEEGIDLPLQVVTDGQMAIDYLSGEGAFADRNEFPMPCLILLDLKLPRKSGFEVLEWIREQSAFRCIVVIVLTSAEHEQDVAQAYELGANSYVVKAMDIAHRNETTRFLKGWWLQCNRFARLPKNSV
jgi:DNA-binding response OmpR family regulator